MPVGIIDSKTDHGAVFTMTRPDDHNRIAAGDTVTVWDLYTPRNALARYRGTIDEVRDTTASFTIDTKEIDHDWPQEMDPISPGNAVYLALPQSFQPNPTRTASREELAKMQEIADAFQARTGITTAGPADLINHALHRAGIADTAEQEFQGQH